VSDPPLRAPTLDVHTMACAAARFPCAAVASAGRDPSTGKRPPSGSHAAPSTSSSTSSTIAFRSAVDGSVSGSRRRRGCAAAASAVRSPAEEEEGGGGHYYSSDAAGPADVDTLIAGYLADKRNQNANGAADDTPTSASAPVTQQRLVGRVYLIGTGPGDPGLLTLKAFHLMQTADVVLYDRLVSPAILDLVHRDAKMLYVGKQAGFHTRTQDEIEAMLLGLAGNGATVVRLKGGDPLVFGRGGEEMEVLMSRGHEVHIVPGITAAAGVGSELGIPLTHRGTATSVRLLTGHLREGAARDAADGAGNAVVDPVDFAVTAADLDTTLVVYMGLGTLPSLASKLIASGFPRDMPAVAVERGTTPRERRVFSTIGNLPAAVVAEKLRSPTLIIVGNTVALSPWWPWHALSGESMEEGGGDAATPPRTRPGAGVTYVAQRGLPSEDTSSWFREDSEVVKKLRVLGREAHQEKQVNY